MHTAVCLVPLLVLGVTWSLQNNQILTQEYFDFEQFIGRWYEIAVISTCPHFMLRKKGNPVMFALELKNATSEGIFTMTASTFRNGSCEESTTNYSLTGTPGRFFHHVARFNADVDSFVVHTNYNKYAMILQLSTEKPSGNKTTIVKLYSRTVTVTPLVLDQFKTLVRQHGIKEDAIIINQHKGECAPGGQMTEANTSPTGI
ncbi:protein AMBP [Nothobranchius furzeri]|uniref:Protein AMBP-like n=1 Tax=Nothobranchius furzeri TaxID=105023 RepID=A0A9D3BSE4_NOTFU|nr:protein AMBP [Nothobranchius furzeri]KAF7216953.1 protein AMBP-like [Nothobranchius furzeri]